MNLRAIAALVAVGSLSIACASASDSSDAQNVEQHWDSADGNPTHATHSRMAEYAITQLGAELPEVVTYQADIVRGANLELHDLVSKTHEALRLEIGGNNWAADHPEIIWDKARASYAAGAKSDAYFYVGILLHYVQDMGVPAHAFHVIHQSGPSNWDHLELLGFFDFHASFQSQSTPDPALENPVDYVEWSGQTARDHFTSTYDQAAYNRNFFPQAYDAMTDKDWAFLRRREAECARGTAYALRSAAMAFASVQ